MRRSSASSLLGETQDLRFDPVARGGADDLVASSPRGAQLLGDARPLAAAHQDLVVDEPLELTDGLLEVLLLALLDFALVDEHGLVHRIVEPLRVHGDVELPAVGRLQAARSGRPATDRSARRRRRRRRPAVERARSRHSRPAQRARTPALSGQRQQIRRWRPAGAPTRPSRPARRGRPRSPRGPGDAARFNGCGVGQPPRVAGCESPSVSDLGGQFGVRRDVEDDPASLFGTVGIRRRATAR